MELQIGTDEFSRALYRAQGIVEKKSTMPILASVLLEATEDGRMRVSAFDLEIGVTGTHPCEVRKGGSVALKHKELYDIVRALPEKSAVLRREANNRVRLTSGAAEFNIVGQPAEDYPPFPRSEKVNFVPVDPTAFSEMIEKTQFAISADETRHNLNGVYFEDIKAACAWWRPTATGAAWRSGRSTGSSSSAASSSRARGCSSCAGSWKSRAPTIARWASPRPAESSPAARS